MTPSMYKLLTKQMSAADTEVDTDVDMAAADNKANAIPQPQPSAAGQGKKYLYYSLLERYRALLIPPGNTQNTVRLTSHPMSYITLTAKRESYASVFFDSITRVILLR